MDKKEAAVSFLQLVASGRVRDGYSNHVGPGFRHHNPYFRAEPEALMKGMEDNARQFPDKRLVVLHAIQDGDFVAVHSHVRHKPEEPGFAVMHLFRFEGDRFVELWDVAQQVPAESPNANGMF
jgi:predicted SnoaL-like aldol condensation-catalyzing enzyme